MDVSRTTRTSRVAWRRRVGPIVALIVAVANIVLVTTLPDRIATNYGAALFGAAFGAVLITFLFARQLRRPTRSARVVLFGGPCDGQLVLTSGVEMPREVWLVGPDGATSTYRTVSGRDRERGVLRYQAPTERRSSTRG